MYRHTRRTFVVVPCRAEPLPAAWVHNSTALRLQLRAQQILSLCKRIGWSSNFQAVHSAGRWCLLRSQCLLSTEKGAPFFSPPHPTARTHIRTYAHAHAHVHKRRERRRGGNDGEGWRDRKKTHPFPPQGLEELLCFPFEQNVDPSLSQGIVMWPAEWISSWDQYLRQELYARFPKRKNLNFYLVTDFRSSDFPAPIQKGQRLSTSFFYISFTLEIMT